mmetsp:Transcript_129447/g.192704  ORF Transcript_129447/g.192704 Transcript_129447/m.192704 type:complete len:454 (+) Transcript_129447:232-1593(+)
MKYLFSILGLLSFLSESQNVKADQGPIEYGVDVSYPMHHPNVTNNYAWMPWNTDPSVPTPDEYKGIPVQPLGDKKSFYDGLIQGCQDYYGEKKGRHCLANEIDRVQMSLRQPKGMVNYTKNGYTKMRAPENVFKLIKEFWDKNRDNQRLENWPSGNTYVNHWESPTYLTSVEDGSMEGGGYILKQHIWNAARDTISAWTGQQLAECSLYGIRIYKEGAVLATHVDRLPLVSSAIINVDQDVDEPWPLEVIGHDGKAVNVTMVPGDLVLYESHSILHGRPFPLKGRFMANVFIHFEPIGAVGEEIDLDPDLPGYVIRGSEEEKNWRRRHPNGYQLLEGTERTPGSTLAHQAANANDKEVLRRVLKEQPHTVNARDANGWMPIHEAVRKGDMETVKILMEHGADVNSRTKGSERGASGGTALWWALEYHDDDHEVVSFLKEQGAKHISPGGRDEL